MPGDGRAERGRLESPGFGEESAGHIPGRWPPMGAARFAGRRLGDGDSRLGARGKSAPRLEKGEPQRAQRDTKITKLLILAEPRRTRSRRESRRAKRAKIHLPLCPLCLLVSFVVSLLFSRL